MKEESKENDNISIQKEKDTSKKDIQDLNKKKKNRTYSKRYGALTTYRLFSYALSLIS